MQLDEKLIDLGVNPQLAALARAAASERSVQADRRSDYVSVRPYPVGAIAAYFHAERVSIAMDPHAALIEVPKLPGAVARPTTPATTYCIVSSEVAAAAPEVVHGWLLTALGWRAQGPNRTLSGGRAGAAPGPEPEICPNCWLAIPCFCET